MKRPSRILALVLGMAAGAAPAQAPTPKDFAHGLEALASSQPVQQFTVPERVYQGVTRADLGDLRVFNAGGIVVPHGLCHGPVVTPETVTEEPLPVFPLRRPPPLSSTGGGRVDVQTSSGVSVKVIEPAPALRPSAVVEGPADTVVADASALRGELRALRLAWSTPDGASEAQVRVEASEDLNQWRTVVAGTTLLHVAADGRALDRNHIDLPQARYRYLRLVRNAGPALRIESVTADAVQAATAATPQWFAAEPVATEDANAFAFDSGRLAPVHAARVVLATSNMALRVAIDSRRDPEQDWQQRWSGDISSVDGGNATETSPFAAVSDPLWRVRVLRGAETLGGGRPTLRLGYHPARLQFLAQGDGPFVVAYGSARVPQAEARSCDALLAPLAPDQRAAMVGNAQVSAAPDSAFGGPDVLAPPPAPTPVRQIVLWAVLLLGTAALVAMALSLLRRLREGESP